MKNSENCCVYTKAQITWLVVLRLFIGWHFMYEGLVKIMNPKWTSMAYLLDSKGPASSFFHWTDTRSSHDEFGKPL